MLNQNTLCMFLNCDKVQVKFYYFLIHKKDFQFEKEQNLPDIENEADKMEFSMNPL